jgi:hypothetical protein|tara:strand:+ start:7753 stop:7968 length:216 start_codon:yes stop_codon:yes gene_type:complete
MWTQQGTKDPDPKAELQAEAEGVAKAAAEGPAPVDPDLAWYMGAFEERALDDITALDSFMDEIEAEGAANG